MKILYTSPIIEYPAAGGPQLRIESSIKALSKVSELYVVSRSSKKDMGGSKAIDYYKSFVKSFSFAPSAYVLSSNRYINKLQRVIKSSLKSTIERDAKFLLSILEKFDIDIIWFGYGNISFDLIKHIKIIRPEIKVICDTDSVWSRFVLRKLPYETNKIRANRIKSKGLKKEREEAEWVNLCDITTAVSEVDAKYYQSIASDKSKVLLFSNAIDIQKYIEFIAEPQGIKKPNIYLAGSFGPKSAMDKAARWFIESVFPIIKKDLPNIHFYIIGRGSKETLKDIKDEKISILGKVDTVLPYLSNANVSIVPLQFESGTRFKIMEAAACKIPIVSTTLGAEGISVTNGHDILIADSSEQFANAVISLLKNKELSQRISDNCFELINENNSIDSLVLEAEEIINRLSK